MIQVNNLQELRNLCFNATIFSSEVLNWIEENNLWNIWVPKKYGGLELSFTEGLYKIKKLAKIDGSLGWTVTLCSGANYFIGNLKPQTAQEIFLKSKHPVCLGGSGGIFGTADKQGDYYKISGKWRYATGAPYLSHFTINAEVRENGVQLRNENDSPKILSFVLPREEVKIIKDWNTMGLRASATHSFKVEDTVIHKRFSFIYNKFYQPQDIFKIPFSVFADLTLWVNYIGMAEHFLEEASAILSKEKLRNPEKVIFISNQHIDRFSEEIEYIIKRENEFTKAYIENIHKTAVDSVHTITTTIIQVYPLLGVKACRKNHQLNQIFQDYFTATQHYIFTRK